MNKQFVKTIIFFLVMAGYLAFPYFSIRSYQKVLEAGEVFKFRPQPVDPIDFFRGRYITLNLRENSLQLDNKTAKFKTGEKVHLTLAKDSLNFARFDRAFKNKPEFTTSYLTSRITYADDNSILFDLPFTQYNINEKLAPLAEKKYNELIRANNGTQLSSANVYLDVSILSGKAQIKELYFENMPIYEYLILQ